MRRESAFLPLCANAAMERSRAIDSIATGRLSRERFRSWWPRPTKLRLRPHVAQLLRRTPLREVQFHSLLAAAHVALHVAVSSCCNFCFELFYFVLCCSSLWFCARGVCRLLPAKKYLAEKNPIRSPSLSFAPAALSRRRPSPSVEIVIFIRHRPRRHRPTTRTRRRPRRRRGTRRRR